MRAPRLSIAGLMVFVLIVAVGIGALKATSPLVASVCFTFTFLALIAGVLLAMHSPERKRAFWAGFSVGGWVYFCFAFFFFAESRSDSDHPQFLTSILFARLENVFFPPQPAVTMSLPNLPKSGVSPFETSPPVTPSVPAPPTLNSVPVQDPALNYYSFYLPRDPSTYLSASFQQIGHSMTTLLLAWSGGLFSLFLADRLKREEASSQTNDTPSA